MNSSSTLKTFHSNFNNLLHKLTEHVAEMKLDQEMSQLNFRTDLMLVNGGNLKPGEEFDSNNCAIHAPETQRLVESEENLNAKLLTSDQEHQFKKIMQTNTETKLDMSQNEMTLFSEFNHLSDKYKRLKVLNELNTIEMSTQIRDTNLKVNGILKDLETTNEDLATSTHQCQILRHNVVELTKKNKEIITILEGYRNKPVEKMELNGEVSLSLDIKNHRIIIQQLKEEILELLQKRNGHIEKIEKTQHQKLVKSLELNLVKYDRKLQQCCADNNMLRHRLQEEKKNQYERLRRLQIEITTLQRTNEQKQRELDNLHDQLNLFCLSIGY